MAVVSNTELEQLAELVTRYPGMAARMALEDLIYTAGLSEERRQWIEKYYCDEACNECRESVWGEHTPDCSVPRLIATE